MATRSRWRSAALLLVVLSSALAARLAAQSSGSPAGTAPPPSTLDRLAAAHRPPAERVDALLAVAALHPASRDADLALYAALCQWRRQRDEGELPDAFRARAGERWRLAESLHLARRARGDADRALHSRIDALLAELGPATGALRRLAPGMPLDLPLPLAAELQVRVDRLADVEAARAAWLLPGEAPPLLDRVVPAGRYDIELPALAPGSYRVLLREVDGARAQVQPLLVSALEVVAQWRGERLVALLLFEGEPAAGGTARFVDEAGVERASGRADAAGLVTLATGAERGVLYAALEREAGRHEALVAVDSSGVEQRHDDLLAHLLVDAPLHRAGDAVRGRVVVREVVDAQAPAIGGAREVALALRPLADAPLEMRFWPGTSDEVVQRGRCDATGLLAFELPLPPTAPLGPLTIEVALASEVPATATAALEPERRATRRVLLQAAPTVVSAVKRPPLLLSVDWPQRFVRGAPRPQVGVVARLPAGAPAGELEGTLCVRTAGYEEIERFVLDGEGRATLPLACETLATKGVWAATHLALELRVVAPDGQEVVQRGQLLLERPAAEPSKTAATDDATAEASAAEATDAPIVLALDCTTATPIAGAPLAFALRGRPHAWVVVTAGRSVPLAAHALQLDGEGRGEWRVATTAGWWPQVEVVASSERAADASPEESGGWGSGWCGERWNRDGGDRCTQTVALRSPRGPVAAQLREADATFAPGTTTTLHLDTRTADGAPCAASVAVAIVDESLFLLERDRTLPPWRALEPEATFAREGDAVTLAPTSRRRLFGELFRDGVLTDRFDSVAPNYGSGGATVGPGSGNFVRDELRAVAAFLPAVRTDGEGRGEFTVTWPDDLARWRVTLVAVTDGEGGEITRAHVETARDPDVTLLVPRFLRAGDRVEVLALATTRSATPREVALDVTLHAVPDGALGGPFAATAGAPTAAPLRTTLTAASPWRVALPLQALAPGAAALTVELPGLDGERRALPLLPATLERRTSATGALHGTTPLELAPPPIAGATAGALTVTVLADRGALLAEAAEWLGAYPHGCAEQTLSRLAPLFAAASARRRLAPAAAPLDAEQTARFAAGMARVRQLADPDGYAWWPGGELDLAMTPVVLHGLALARDAGLDPARHGALRDFSRGLLGECAKALQDAGGDPRAALAKLPRNERLGDPSAGDDEAASEPFRAQRLAELAVAALVAAPSDATARAAVVALLQGDAPLTPSLQARSGLAAFAAGERAAAERAWSRPTGAAATPEVVPLEADEVTRVAHRLALAQRLGRPAAEREPLVAALLQAFAEGRVGTTWATAVALCALADDAARDGGDVAATAATDAANAANAAQHAVPPIVECDGVRVELRARGAGRFVGELPAPLGTAAGRVRVVGHAGGSALVVVARRWQVAALPEASWSAPFDVTREAWRIVRRDGREVREPLARDGAAWRCRVGDTLECEVTLRAPSGASYVACTVPLPAGVELVDRDRGGEARDEAVVFAAPRIAPLQPHRFTVRMVAAFAGRFAWPGAVVEAMYRPEQSGACGSAELAIAPRGETVAVTPTWLLPEALARNAERWARAAGGATDQAADDAAERAAELLREEDAELPLDPLESVVEAEHVANWFRAEVAAAVAPSAGVRSGRLSSAARASLAAIEQFFGEVAAALAVGRPTVRRALLAQAIATECELPELFGAPPHPEERRLLAAREVVLHALVDALLAALDDPAAPIDALAFPELLARLEPTERLSFATRCFAAAERRGAEGLDAMEALLDWLEDEVELATPLGGKLVRLCGAEAIEPSVAEAAWWALSPASRAQLPFEWLRRSRAPEEALDALLDVLLDAGDEAAAARLAQIDDATLLRLRLDVAETELLERELLARARARPADFAREASRPAERRWQLLLALACGEAGAVERVRERLDGETAPGERAELEEALLPHATVEDLLARRFERYSDRFDDDAGVERLRAQFVGMTAAELSAAFAADAARCTGRAASETLLLPPLELLVAAPAAAWRAAWPDYVAWRERCSPCWPEFAREELAELECGRTGHVTSWRDDAGVVHAVAPTDAEEWRELALAFAAFEGRPPSAASEPAALVEAWREEELARGLSELPR
ncbi:MAG: hypothetical protein JNL90_14070 [Planctomycetes bacterium]|nr:hypothetical protein [Planctomycetota bacterium]